MRPAFWFVSLLAVCASLGACGGEVVYQTGEPEGGAGGGVLGTDCVAGTCGDSCTKCVGQSCTAGVCAADGSCVPVETPTTCVDG